MTRLASNPRNAQKYPKIKAVCALAVLIASVAGGLYASGRATQAVDQPTSPVDALTIVEDAELTVGEAVIDSRQLVASGLLAGQLALEPLAPDQPVSTSQIVAVPPCWTSPEAAAAGFRRTVIGLAAPLPSGTKRGEVIELRSAEAVTNVIYLAERESNHNAGTDTPIVSFAEVVVRTPDISDLIGTSGWSAAAGGDPC